MPPAKPNKTSARASLEERVALEHGLGYTLVNQRCRKLEELHDLRKEINAKIAYYTSMVGEVEQLLCALDDPYMTTRMESVDLKCEPLDQQQLEALRGLVGKKEE